MDGKRVRNAIGDSFLNKCLATTTAAKNLQGAFVPIFGWTEPYPLLILILIILIVFPSIFKASANKSFLKLSRFYNITRLGLLSLLHQICYSYTFTRSLSTFIHQSSPCSVNNYFILTIRKCSFPSDFVFSASIFLFAVLRFSGTKSKIIYGGTFLLLIPFFVLACLDYDIDPNTSIFQCVCTFFMAYIMHYIHLRIPFKYIHVENAFWFLITTIAVIYWRYCEYNSVDNWKDILFRMWFSYVTTIVDEFLFIRHQYTRKGFTAIERPADVKWVTPAHCAESMRLLNSDEEESFYPNVRNDIITAFVAFCMFYIGVLFRNLLNVEGFFYAPN